MRAERKLLTDDRLAFNLELHHKSWESVMRGNDDMMNKLYGTVNDMFSSKNKPDTVDGKVTTLDAQEFRL